MNLLRFEPVAVLAFVRAVLYLAVLFGFSLTNEQILGIVAVVETGFAIVTRSKVTPVAKLQA